MEESALIIVATINGVLNPIQTGLAFIIGVYFKKWRYRIVLACVLAFSLDLFFGIRYFYSGLQAVRNLTIYAHFVGIITVVYLSAGFKEVIIDFFQKKRQKTANKL